MPRYAPSPRLDALVPLTPKHTNPGAAREGAAARRPTLTPTLTLPHPNPDPNPTQVLHAKELQRRLDANDVRVRTASVCPGFVATNILPDDPVGRAAAALAFSPEQGNLALMCALFDPSLTGGEFVGHYQNFFTRQRWLIDLLARWGLREALVNVVVAWVLLFQKRSYGVCQVEPSSPESEDEELARALFDWSKSEVSRYLGVVIE